MYLHKVIIILQYNIPATQYKQGERENKQTSKHYGMIEKTKNKTIYWNILNAH